MSDPWLILALIIAPASFVAFAGLALAAWRERRQLRAMRRRLGLDTREQRDRDKPRPSGFYAKFPSGPYDPSAPPPPPARRS
jgi:hypothetical protein